MNTSSLILKNDLKKGIVCVESKHPILDIAIAQFVLNLALITQFGLVPNPRAEGGIKKLNVSLLNIVDESNCCIGLIIDPETSRGPNKQEKEILAWYAELLKLVFIKGCLIRKLPYVLWLSEKYKGDSYEKICLLRDAVILSERKAPSIHMSNKERFSFWWEKMPIKLIELYGNILLPDILPQKSKSAIFSIAALVAKNEAT